MRTVFKSIAAALPGRDALSLMVAIPVLLGVIGLSVTIWLVALNVSIPFLSLDDWVAIDHIGSRDFVAAVFTGRNGYPIYFQNLLLLIDLDYFNAEKVGMLWFQNTALFIGCLLLLLSIRRAGLPWSKLLWTSVLLLVMWFSVHNSAHYGAWYVYRGIESSGVFLFLATSLLFSLRVVFRSGTRLDGNAITNYTAAVVCAWLALYFHGGFLLLPTMLGVMTVATRDRRLKWANVAIVVVFAYHFVLIHTLSGGSAGAVKYFEAALHGFLIFPANLAYHSVTAQLGADAAAWSAVIISVTGMGFASWLVYALASSSEKRELRFVAAVLLIYPLAIAASVTYARLLNQPDWHYALDWRYRSYSALFLTGLLLAAWALPVGGEVRRVWRSLQVAVIVLVGGIGAVTLTDSAMNARSVWWMPAYFQSYMVPFTFDDHLLADRNIMTKLRREHARNFQVAMEKNRANVYSSPGYSVYRKFRDGVFDLSESEHIETCNVNWQPVKAEDTASGRVLEITGWLSTEWRGIAGTALFFDAHADAVGWAPRFRPERWPWEAEFWDPEAGGTVWGYALLSAPVDELQAVLVDTSGHTVCRMTPVFID